MSDSVTYDCIVVGGGNAGFSAAHSAIESGCSKVLIVDACSVEYKGGNSYFTAGAFRTVHDGLQDVKELVDNITPVLINKIDIDPYTANDFTNDIMRMSNQKSNFQLVEELVSSSRETVRWLKDYVGIPFSLSFNRQAYAVGGRQKFWGGMVLAVTNGGIGLMRQHFEKADKEGILYLHDCRVVRLILSGKGVTGVQLIHEGQKKEINSRNVVIACGGFEANKELRSKYLGESWARAKVRGTPHNQGDGFILGEQVGAQEVGDRGGCHSTCWDAGAAADHGDRIFTNQFTKSGYPLGIMVNVFGKRFADEGEDMRNYTYAKLGRIINEQPEGIAWQVWDSKTIPLLREEEYGDGVVEKCIAEGLESLAFKLTSDGLRDPEGFIQTIYEFNHAVTEHRKEATNTQFDPSRKDGLSTQSSKMSLFPPKSNWAQAFNSGPFMAVKVACGITFTFYGLKIDPRTAAVIGKNGQPVAGLYCVGEMVGDLFHYNYPGGSGLTAGAVWGRKAGKAIGESCLVNTY